MKSMFAVFLCILGLSALSCVVKSARKTSILREQGVTAPAGIDSSRLLVTLPDHIEKLNRFIKSGKGAFNSATAFLVDMRIPSRFFRFFVVDLETGTVLQRALVAHGAGSETTIPDSLVFSNVPNSYMSSLGRYKIGAGYAGSFGRAFRLHGLNPSNSKALSRAIVLHRYSCLPDEEQFFPICTSLGCPMVSEAFFPELEKYIDASAKPILLEIYY